MATSPMAELIHQLRRTVLLRDGAGLTDGQLLGEYISRHDEAALATLVQRHARMVWGVCRRVLGQYHDAEDAFQATFLVLVRKATSVRPREMVVNWLYGVAYQTALKARATAGTRKGRERQVVQMPEPAVAEPAQWDELLPLLDEELSRLPDQYRAVIVLGDLEGKTRKEVARHLGVPEGTVAGRAARARVMLADRLTQRGVTLSGGALAVVLSQNVTSAGLPVSVVSNAIKAAGGLAAGQAVPGLISVQAASLTEGVLKAMMLSKLKSMMGVLLLATAFVVGAVGVIHQPEASGQEKAEPKQPQLEKKEAVNQPFLKEAKNEKAGWREAFVLKHEHPVNIVACSADLIVAGDEGGNLYVCDAKTGKNRTLYLKRGEEKDLDPSVNRLQFTTDGKHLFAVLNERRGIIRFNTDPKSDEQSPGVSFEHPTFLGTSADGEFWLELQSAHKRLALRPNPWTHDAVLNYESILYEAKISHAVLSADDKWLAVVTADENLRIHDRASLEETRTISLAKQTVNAIDFSKDGKRLAVVGLNGFAKLYDTENGTEVATLKGHGGIIFCVAFSPDGKTVVTGGDDNVARVWDTADGSLLAVLEGHKDSVRSVAFDPREGMLLITGSADKTLRTWKLTNAREDKPKRGDDPAGPSKPFALRPDEKDTPKDVNPKMIEVRLHSIAPVEGKSYKIGIDIDRYYAELDDRGVPRTEFVVSDDAVKVTIDGKPAKIADLVPGIPITIQLTADKKSLARIEGSVKKELDRLRERVRELERRMDKPVKEKMDAPVKEKGMQAKLIELRNILSQKVDSLVASQKEGAVPLLVVWKEKLRLYKVDLELAESIQQRIEVLEKTLAVYKLIEDRAIKEHEFGAIPTSMLADAKANRLEAEIALEREKAKLAPAKPR